VGEDVKVRHRLTQPNTLSAESSALRYALCVHPDKQQIEANPFENAV